MDANQRIILMYHGIVSDKDSVPSDREVGAGLYDVSGESFRKHLTFLKDSGCFITTLDKESALPEGRRIILTFDDGELNNYTQALPLLKEFGVSAYFFITVNRIGKKGYMGWKEIKALRDANMIIGSHSLNHVILIQLKQEDVYKELKDSKQILEDNLQVPVNDFSVPRGFYNKEIIDSALSAGYARIFISEVQNYTDENCFPRVAVKGNWSVSRLENAFNCSIPLGEKVFQFGKKCVRNVLGSRGYDSLRSILIRK